MPRLEDIIRQYGQIPELTDFEKIMFVGPHPDDIEFGCGGLISKLKGQNKEIVYVIVTDGAAGSDDPNMSPQKLAEIRKNECLNAAEFMGVKKVEFLNLEDGGEYSCLDIVRKIAPIVLKYQPQIIFAPDYQLETECHPDHLKTGLAIRELSQIISHPESLRRHHIDVNGITCFPTNTTLAFYFSDNTNKKVSILPEDLQNKIASLMLHKSQMNDSSTELLINYFQLKALKVGEGLDSSLAEDYKVLLPLMQHVYAEGVHI